MMHEALQELSSRVKRLEQAKERSIEFRRKKSAQMKAYHQRKKELEQLVTDRKPDNVNSISVTHRAEPRTLKWSF